MQPADSVEACEERLRSAMIAGDVEGLSDLIEDDLVFTGPTGTVITKGEDLDAHRSQRLRIRRLDLFETRLHPVGGFVVATTKARLEATFADQTVSGVFAYTRVWRRSDTGWRVQAGHCARLGDL